MKPLDSPHDGTDISGQVPAAGSGGEVLLRVQPVSVDHEIAVGQISERRGSASGMKPLPTGST